MSKLPRLLLSSGALFLSLASTIAAPAQVFTVLWGFDSNDGAYPLGALAQGTDGDLYGTTSAGGYNAQYGGYGTVFKITPGGTFTKLHEFCLSSNCADGASPYGGLVLGTDGNFFGTTYSGGVPYDHGDGTFFKFSPTGMLTTLYDFCVQGSRPVCADGREPTSGLILATDGNFYGTAQLGGSLNCEPGGPYPGCGTIFKVTETGSLTALHYLAGYPTEGSYPQGTLVEDASGNFYGTTSYGGSADYGTIFKIALDGRFSPLHDFTGNDGARPFAGLIQASDGDFYGVTQQGGMPNCVDGGCGTVFRMTPDGVVTTLHYFDGNDGAYPTPSLIRATDGNLYGVTSAGGGTNSNGTIFKITLTGVLTTVFRFTQVGGAPQNPLLQVTNGLFYGSANGGKDNVGILFSLDMSLGPFITFVRNSGKIGQTGGILGQGLTGTTSVSLNGTPAAFTVVSDTYLTATVPPGATTGYVTVTTPIGTLTSNVPFRVIP